MMPKINKNIIIGISVAIILVFCLFFGWFSRQKEKVALEQEIIEEKEETMEEVLERLTPKEIKPLAEEEKNEQEKLLKQLTPTKPMTEKEQKELEELLKKLTP
ncbi:MAG: hypothetical protein NTZ84_03625 [Candidatus Nealsonbacteria bacterium]|nr:hypothetical protein [Candidatus Nealsonbacteria bacterium]